jgi:hypothetical protein
MVSSSYVTMYLQPQDEVKAFETRSMRTKSKKIPGLAPVTAAVAETKKSKPYGDVRQEQKSKSSVSRPTPSTVLSIPVASCSALVSESAATGELVTIGVEKRVKALRKKLREIEELQTRDESALSPEQLEKLGRRSALENELSRLSLAAGDK